MFFICLSEPELTTYKKKKLTLAVSQHTRILLDGAQETYYSSDLRKHSQTSQSFVCSAEILLFL